MSLNELRLSGVGLQTCTNFNILQDSVPNTIVHSYIHSYRDQCRGAYLFQGAKRLWHAEIELAHLELYRQHLKRGADAAAEAFPRFDLGGMDAQRQFVEAYNQLPNTVPMYGLAEGKEARGGSNVKGNEVRNLAFNPHAAQEFVFPNQLTAWVKRSDLRETFPLSDNGVTEWELYGKDVGEQGASIARTLSRN